MTAWFELDKKIFLAVNGCAGSWMDYAMGWTTFLATPVVLYLVIALLFIWDPQHAVKRFAVVLLAAASVPLANSLFKHLIHRNRPYEIFYQDVADGKVVVHYLFNTFVSNSFPSGHAAFAFAIAAALNVIYKNKLLYLYPVALWLGLTRVYVGAHFPSDVLAGAVLGTIVGTAVAAAASKIPALK